MANMGNGLSIHHEYTTAGGIQVQLMRLCGVDRIRAFNPGTGRYSWSNVGDAEAMLQRVDSTNIRDSHEQVYQSLLTQQQSH